MSAVPNPDGPETVAEILRLEFARDPGRVFCTADGVDTTIAELWDLVARTANALAALGMKPGHRVATLVGNGRTIVQVMLAALSTGTIWVPINVHLRGAGLAHVLTDSSPTVLLIDTALVSLADLPREAMGSCVVVEMTGGAVSFEDLTATAPATTDGLPRASADDVVAISYTSGTTGPAKGVMLTNRMFVTCGRAIEIAVEPRPGDVFYVWEPMYHIGGNQTVVVALRNPVRLAIAPRFSVGQFWSDVAEQRVTHVHYLGGMLQILVKGAMPDRHGIRVLWGGGCPAALWGQVAGRFGLTPTEVYGMTEGSSITTVNRGGPPGSVGVPLPFYDIAVVAEDGSVQPPGATGEVVVRDRGSGRLTSGYWHQPEATRRLLPGDGLMHTGDLGCLDADGHLYFVGRKNDSVRNNGENVSAWEVESTVASHPDVAECAMIGVNSDHGDQDIKMFVRLRPGAQLEPQELSDWCSTRLARFQLPRYITMVTDLPKTPTLRIRKEMLRQLGDTPWDRLAAMSPGNAP